MDTLRVPKPTETSRGRRIESSSSRSSSGSRDRALQISPWNKAYSYGDELDVEDLVSQYAKSSQRLLIFDYDGTLTPLVDDPEAAVPSKAVQEALTSLSSTSNTTVWLVSGRRKSFLEKHFGLIKSLGLCAEHGCFARKPGQEKWESPAEEYDKAWQALVEPHFKQLVTELPGSEIEKKEVAIVWHYRNADRIRGSEKAKETQVTLIGLLSQWDVEVVLGSNILEVRLKSLNKGSIVAGLVEETFQSGDGFIFCAGDDTTDEDMFQALLNVKQQKIYTCLVSTVPKWSFAQYRVSTPIDMEKILCKLL